MTNTRDATTIILDSGQHVRIQSDPYQAHYQCHGCKSWAVECSKLSEWDGEKFQRFYFCDECLERRL